MTQNGHAQSVEKRDQIDRIQVIVAALVGLVATISLASLPYVQHVNGIAWYSVVVGVVVSACFGVCIAFALRRPLPRAAIRWTMATVFVVTIAATAIVVLTHTSSDYGTSILVAFATVFAAIVFAMTFTDDRRDRRR